MDEYIFLLTRFFLKCEKSIRSVGLQRRKITRKGNGLSGAPVKRPLALVPILCTFLSCMTYEFPLAHYKGCYMSWHGNRYKLHNVYAMDVCTCIVLGLRMGAGRVGRPTV